MEKPLSFKELLELAKTCRKAGINTFKGFGVEFNLSDVFAPQVKTRKPRSKVSVGQAAGSPDAAQFEDDSLSESDLLFWSTGLTDPGAPAPQGDN